MKAILPILPLLGLLGLPNLAETYKVCLTSDIAEATHPSGNITHTDVQATTANTIFSHDCETWEIVDDWNIIAWCINFEGTYGKTYIGLDDILVNDHGQIKARYKGGLSGSCYGCLAGTTYSTITCLCSNGKGVQVYSSIDLDGVIGVDQGLLAFRGYNPTQIENGYFAPTATVGSSPEPCCFWESCSNHNPAVVLQEPENSLWAMCRHNGFPAGGFIWSKIDLDLCFGNDHGSLVPGANLTRDGCTNCTSNGAVLICSCPDDTGNHIVSRINMDVYIANRNGVLCCHGGCGVEVGPPAPQRSVYAAFGV